MGEIEANVGNLVARTLSGDEEAFTALYRLYERRMVAVAHRRLGHTLHGLMESVDLVQSVWTDALASLDRFEDRGPDSFFAWLDACLVHKIETKRRYHVAQKRNAKRLGPLPGDDVLAPREARSNSDPTPSQDAVRDEDVGRLFDALKRFAPEQREILLLRMADGLSYEEIGERVGKSTEAVKKAYNRGLRRLIEMLPAEWQTGQREPGGPRAPEKAR